MRQHSLKGHAMFSRITKLWFLGSAGLVLTIAFAGCDQNMTGAPSSSRDALPNPPATNVEAPRTKVNIETGSTHVDVKKPGDSRPAVDVNVVPGAGVDVNVDRDKIRQNAEERRQKLHEHDTGSTVSP